MFHEKRRHVDVLFSYFLGALNISSPQPKAQPPDNRTIQIFVKDYVDKYVGEYNTCTSHVSLLFCYYLNL